MLQLLSQFLTSLVLTSHRVKVVQHPGLGFSTGLKTKCLKTLIL